MDRQRASCSMSINALAFNAPFVEVGQLLSAMAIIGPFDDALAFPRDVKLFSKRVSASGATSSVGFVRIRIKI